jgi:hypothetical protein
MKTNLTISQALKEKNKMATKIQRNWAKIISINSLPKGANRPYKGFTYCCISSKGIAVTELNEKGPFFEVTLSAIEIIN